MLGVVGSIEWAEGFSLSSLGLAVCGLSIRCHVLYFGRPRLVLGC